MCDLISIYVYCLITNVSLKHTCGFFSAFLFSVRGLLISVISLNVIYNQIGWHTS